MIFAISLCRVIISIYRSNVLYHWLNYCAVITFLMSRRLFWTCCNYEYNSLQSNINLTRSSFCLKHHLFISDWHTNYNYWHFSNLNITISTYCYFHFQFSKYSPKFNCAKSQFFLFFSKYCSFDQIESYSINFNSSPIFTLF